MCSMFLNIGEYDFRQFVKRPASGPRLQGRFLRGALFSGFGLFGTDALSAGLTSSFPALNKIACPGSIATFADTFGPSGTNLCEYLFCSIDVACKHRHHCAIVFSTLW